MSKGGDNSGKSEKRISEEAHRINKQTTCVALKSKHQIKGTLCHRFSVRLQKAVL